MAVMTTDAKRTHYSAMNSLAHRCTATSKRSGDRCRNPAVKGYSVCRMHGAGNRKKGTRGGRPPKFSKWIDRGTVDLIAKRQRAALVRIHWEISTAARESIISKLLVQKLDAEYESSGGQRADPDLLLETMNRLDSLGLKRATIYSLLGKLIDSEI